MLDHTNAPNGESPLDRNRAHTAPAPALTDREVPIENTRKMAALHAWLDGEGSLAAATQGETGRYVEFWSRVNTETEVRRQVTAPVDLPQRIMEALPQATPQAIESWWSRPVAVTPAVALAAAAGLVALGAALAAPARLR
jgi:hypothetical protein